MVNERLRTAIRERYASESQLAERLGWTRQKMSKTVRGERNPRISDINALSREMRISVGEVISFFDQ